MWFFIKMTKRIYKSAFHKPIKPSSFCWQKPRNSSVSHWIVNVYCFVTNIIITTNNQVWNFIF